MQQHDFCNNTLFGTLNAGIIIDPKTADQLGQSLDQAIADLRYGTVAINYWPAVNFVLGTTTWGAYPGHSLNDIQSGIGTVYNSLMFDKPQKIRSLRSFPAKTQTWLVRH